MALFVYPFLQKLSYAAQLRLRYLPEYIQKRLYKRNVVEMSQTHWLALAHSAQCDRKKTIKGTGPVTVAELGYALAIAASSNDDAPWRYAENSPRPSRQ